MIDFIVFFVIAVSFVYLLSLTVKLRVKNLSLINENLEVYIRNSIISDELKNRLEQADIQSVGKNDDFLKFISQSRDWAFEYIETTQEEIYQFIEKAGPVIEYLDEFDPPIITDAQKKALIEGYYAIKTSIPDEYGKLDT
jgi:hypothetical protein